MKPHPKPKKQEKEQMTSWEFRKKYGTKLQKKNSKPKKGKGSEYSILVKQADDWFSRAVRLSASDKNGFGRCISCGKTKEVKYMDCGHFFSRKHKSTRWEHDNCALQCKKCNSNMGNPEINQAFRNALLGLGINLEKLEIKKNNTYKPSQFELEVLIKKFQKIVGLLLKQKDLQKWW